MSSEEQTTPAAPAVRRRRRDTQEPELVRVFCGLAIDDDTRAAMKAALGPIRDRLHYFRWVATADWHVTLKFYGSVERPRIEQIGNALERTGMGPIAVEVRGAGAFPDMREPKVLWVGVRGQKRNQLRDLYRRVNDLSAQIGFEREERKFRPHVTIARVGRNTQPVARELTPLMDAPIARAALDQLVLWKSEFTDDGTVYTRLRTIRLNGT